MFRFGSARNLGKLAYCEAKIRFDHLYGDLAPEHIERRREEGTKAHAKFENEGRGGDKRCFVATCAYGIDAPQTNTLRAFRDRILMPSAVGRVAVQIYYATSPSFVRLVERHPALLGPVRRVLDRVVAIVKRI